MKKVLTSIFVVGLTIAVWVFLTLNQPVVRPSLAKDLEMKHVKAKIVIDAPIEKIWKIIAEDFDRNSRFNSNAKTSEYLKRVDGMLGAQRRTVNHNGKYANVEVTGYNPANHYVRWEIIEANVAPIKAGLASYTLHQNTDGTVTLTQEASFKMKLFFMDPIAKGKFTTIFKNELSAIKHLAETDVEVTRENQRQITKKYAQAFEIVN